jgi:xanthine dehydrogenase accessory factor
LVRFEVSEIDALIAGLPTAGSARCLVVPADTFPGELWEMAAARQPLCLVCRIEGDEVAQISLYSAENVGDASPVVEQLFQAGASGSTLIDDEVITVLRPVSQLVIVGDTPVGDALAELASLVGWKTRVFNDAASATGVIATLSQLDKVVVTAHDLDLAGAALMAALESQVGYIGALGAHRMQENRADWLAYRGVTDLSRIHGPAGFDIGAETPSEIAVSILAEAIGAGVADRVSD